MATSTRARRSAPATATPAVTKTKPAAKAAAPVVAPAPADKPEPKAAVKPAAKAARKGAGKSGAKAAAPKPAPAAKPPRKPKPVLVRDGFTMPEADFALIAQLKKRAAAAGRESKKSEVLRAALRTLAALEAPALLAALGGLEPVKVGRPRKGH